VVSEELLKTVAGLGNEIFLKKMGKGWILLRLWHMRHREKNELIFVKLHLWCSGLQILLECHRTAVVESVLSSQVWVDVVDAEIYLKVELQSSRVLINRPKLIGMFEKLVSISSIKKPKQQIFIRVLSIGSYLCSSFDIGSFCSESVIRPSVTINQQVLLDQLR